MMSRVRIIQLAEFHVHSASKYPNNIYSESQMEARILTPIESLARHLLLASGDFGH